MADEKPQRRLLRLLRRKPKGYAREAEQQSALWSAHERASQFAREMSATTSRVSSHIARQRAAMDTVSDGARALAARLSELAHGQRRVLEAFERLSIVALNASLEGARQAESVARPLLLIGDEVRSLALRGSEIARELDVLASDVQSELGHVAQSADNAKEIAGEAQSDMARVADAAAKTERALQEAKEHLKRTTGTDPEAMKALSDAAEHARALVVSLGTLSGKVPQGLLASVLRPAIEPLLRLLSVDDEEETPP
jgi:hypothetical protein